MFNSLRCLLSLALMLGVAAPALADDPAEPATCKARGAKRVVVGEFQFTLAQLNAYRNVHRFATRPPGASAIAKTEHKRATLADLIAVIDNPQRNARLSVANSGEHGPITSVPIDEKGPDAWCGIVDEWHYSALLARQICNSLPGSNGQAYFKADPAYTAFNDTANHHTSYKAVASQNAVGGDFVLHGDCYVCTSGRSIGPATAIPRDQVKVQPPKKGD
ncbi:MAG: hypothetical protein IT473_10565 [Lysobacter sp.]|nr:hypothetical protein [Lysobacter sp.]